VEELYAAVYGGVSINLKPSKVIPQSATVANGQALFDHVFICGTYFNNLDSVGTWSARPIVLVYSAEDAAAQKYGSQYTYLLLRDEFSSAIDVCPWIEHILRRTRADAKPEDEEFYRGLIHYGGDRPLRELFISMLKQKDDPARLIAAGSIVCRHIDDAAKKYQANSAARTMLVNGRPAAVLAGAWSPVLPIVKQLATDAEFGVLVRYNLQTLHTHLTFCTATPESVDLSFVRAPPYSGGGDKLVMGATIRGIIPIVEGASLEECIARIQA
jgi:hypothetical protein